MRKISSLTTQENFQLLVQFDNGIKKIFDLKPYLNYPVFEVLKNQIEFQKVTNQGYFIEWKDHEVDLSADTLWHDGK